MSMKKAIASEAQEILSTCALTSLLGLTTSVLMKLPKDEALAAIDNVRAGRASFAWSIEAEAEEAVIKAEFCRPDGTRVTLLVQRISLALPTDGVTLQ